MFLEHYALRDEKGELDPLERWPEVPPPPYKSLMEYKRHLVHKVYPYCMDKKHIHTSAKQLVAFATRIKPISDLLWAILVGNVQGKGKKNPPQGVSTFCHLEGANDEECLSFLNLVSFPLCDDCSGGKR